MSLILYLFELRLNKITNQAPTCTALGNRKDTVFDYLLPRSQHCFNVENLVRFHSSVDLTGNLILIEKCSLEWNMNRRPPDLQPRRADSSGSSHNLITSRATYVIICKL